MGRLLLAAAVLWGAPSGADPDDVLVVFRTAGALDDCKARMMKRVARVLQGLARVHVLYDPGSGPATVGVARVRTVRRQLFPLPMSMISSEEVLRAFPNTTWPLPCAHPTDLNPFVANFDPRESPCRDASPGVPQGQLARFRDDALERYGTRNVSLLVNFFIHEPSLVLLFRRLPRKPRMLWSFEDDVGMAAPTDRALRQFFLQRGPGSADLWTVDARMGFVHTPEEYVRSSYIWRANTEMLRLFPAPFRKWEHVEGLSARLMVHIGILLDHGAAAHGELFAGSVCQGRLQRLGGFNCTIGLLHSVLHPQQRCYASNVTCNAKMLRICGSYEPSDRAECHKQFPAYAGRWLHPVKNWCRFKEFSGGTAPRGG